MKPDMIAPCGMICTVCLAHLRDDKRCPGCRVRNKGCRVRNCSHWKVHKYRFCYLCGRFPCSRINHLEKRYQERYNMSFIEHLEFIKKNGIQKFLTREKKKWISKEGILCCHDGKRYPLNS